VREWSTAADDLVCPICGPLHGARAEIGEPYLSPTGEQFDGPPAHVSCRCVEAVVLRGFREGEVPSPLREATLRELDIAAAPGVLAGR
jgi:hypothetical protein